jgi:hypothetical protein
VCYDWANCVFFDLFKSQAASVLAELNELCKDVDLTGLEILEEDQRKIRQETARVEKEAMTMLNEGLNKLDKTQVRLEDS